MSVTETQGRQRIGAERIILGLVGILVIVALFYVTSQRQQELRRSPLGLDGLKTWLVAEDQSVQIFSGGWPLDREEVGLNILPIYDTNLAARRQPPRTKEDLLMQQDEYDVELSALADKVSEVTVLAVLPKWRSGMRLTGKAHPILISEPLAIQGVLADIVDDVDPKVRYSRQPFAEYGYEALDGRRLSAVTYASQTFTSRACTPLIGTDAAMILGQCDSRWGPPLLVLSEPDLLNNHGLRLGDNAFIISDVVKAWAEDKQVIIDYSRRSWFVSPEERVTRERTWRDLLRFFEPPFTLMWAGLALSLVLVLWRAFMRFGPLRDSVGEMGAAKALAIGARANLMRLSGQDGALVNEYGRARLAATAAAIFGPAHARQFSSPAAFLAYTERRHPELAGPLATALSDMAAMPATASAGQAMAAVTDLERILEQITHDTRGISRPGRPPAG
ncbi:MAG: hypothetical protein AAGF78_08980 [Pseudomonadota bacterium]